MQNNALILCNDINNMTSDPSQIIELLTKDEWRYLYDGVFVHIGKMVEENEEVQQWELDLFGKLFKIIYNKPMPANMFNAKVEIE